jgi:hypothetical protein
MMTKAGVSILTCSDQSAFAPEYMTTYLAEILQLADLFWNGSDVISSQTELLQLWKKSARERQLA